MEIQRVPAIPGRPETGPMQFGDDWPGVFIRGDNAAYYARTLARVLAGEAGPLEHAIARGLVELLSGCILTGCDGAEWVIPASRPMPHG